MSLALVALIILISLLSLTAVALVVVVRVRAARRAQPPRTRDDARREAHAQRDARDDRALPALRDGTARAPAVHLPGQPLPVVLVHGLLGFDHLMLLGRQLVYFRGIAEYLRDAGADVYTVRLPPLASVPQRAEILDAFVRALPCERVNVIAHSMGGLDARYAITRLGLHEHVASLVTVATPHHGTPLADLGALPPLAAVRALVGQVGLRTDALDWLTTSRAGTFNRDIADVPGVLYGSIVARTAPSAILTNPVLLSGHLYLQGRIGPNDGMVPVESQRWGEVLDEIVADHWAQIGWSRYFDARVLYLTLYQSLRRRGF